MLFHNIELDGKVVYQPQDKQKQFHNAILNRGENGFREFFYGGAAKGGKSESLRWEAHRNCLQYPRLRGLIIRSSFPELERTHLSRVMWDLPAQVASYNQQKHILKYYNESVVEFGYGDKKADFQQYLSAEYDFIMIDELTTIPFEFIVMLKMRLASSRSDFIPFFAAASNPGGIAHVDVRAFYVRKKGVNSELCPVYDPSEVFFLPATVHDNKILTDRDPGLLKRLNALPEKERQKYLLGNWDIFEGQFFDEFNYEVHVVKKKDYLKYGDLLKFNCAGGLDYGNITALECVARDHNGNYILFDECHFDRKVRSVKIKEQKEFLDYRGLSRMKIIADTNMWIPDAFDVETSSMPAYDYIASGMTLLQVSKKSPYKNMTYRVACNDMVRNLLHYEEENGIITQKPKLLIYERCKHLLETFPALITKDNNPEDIADNQEDHNFDGFKYAAMYLQRPIKKEEVDLNMIPQPHIYLRKHGGIKLNDRDLRF